MGTIFESFFKIKNIHQITQTDRTQLYTEGNGDTVNENGNDKKE